jgi:hypothetical protein
MNPDRRGGKLVTNFLSYGTTSLSFRLYKANYSYKKYKTPLK